MNKGTEAGTKEEILLVIELNKKTNNELWKNLNLSKDNRYAIHLNEKKFSDMHGIKIQPKADLYIAEGKLPESFLSSKDYYLCEKDFNRLPLKTIETTGISVKMRTSNSFTYTKISPSTFYRVFSSFELGCGASLFVLKESEITKNELVIKGWNTDKESMYNFFSREIKNLSKEYMSDRLELKKIKEFSNKLIKEKIMNEKTISNFIFFGIGTFEEPYTAPWIFLDGKTIEKNEIPNDFTVTTGSGRSRGDFTIVIKP